MWSQLLGLFVSEPLVNLFLLYQLCGLQLVISLSLLCFLTTGFAGYLVIFARRESLLTGFLPITILPVFVGLIYTFVGMLSSMQMQLDASSDMTIEPAFLLQMNLIPLFAGIIAALPAMLVVVLGRWILVWNASGLQLTRGKDESEDSERFDEHASLARDADDYLERLVRTRW